MSSLREGVKPILSEYIGGSGSRKKSKNHKKRNRIFWNAKLCILYYVIAPLFTHGKHLSNILNLLIHFEINFKKNSVLIKFFFCMRREGVRTFLPVHNCFVQCLLGSDLHNNQTTKQKNLTNWKAESFCKSANQWEGRIFLFRCLTVL